MKVRRFSLIILVVLAALLLSSCSGAAMRGSSWSGLAADDSMAYLADGNLVYGVSLSDGREAWRYPDKADSKKQFFSTPVLTPDGQLLVGSAGSDNGLFSLDPKTGKENGNNWPFVGAKDRWIASPLVVNDTIYAPNGDGSLYALDLKGNLLWSKDLGSALWGQPVSDGKLVYVAALNHIVYALDPQKEDIVWQTKLDGAIPGSPTIGPDGTLYVGTFGSKLEAVSSKGQVLWSADTQGWIWGGPVLDGDSLYFGDLDGYFTSVNATTGKQDWAPVQPDGPIVGSPLALPDYFVVGTESGTVYAIDRQGKTVWDQPVTGKLYSAPVSAGDLILVAPMEADFVLAALDKNGTQVWKFTPQK